MSVTGSWEFRACSCRRWPISSLAEITWPASRSASHTSNDVYRWRHRTPLRLLLNKQESVSNYLTTRRRRSIITSCSVITEWSLWVCWCRARTDISSRWLTSRGVETSPSPASHARSWLLGETAMIPAQRRFIGRVVRSLSPLKTSLTRSLAWCSIPRAYYHVSIQPIHAHCWHMGSAIKHLVPDRWHMGSAIKHLVPDRLKPLFVIFDIRALWRSVLSVRVPGCQKLQMTA